MNDRDLEYVLDGDVVLARQLVDEYRQMRSELEAARSDAALTRCQLKESRDGERQAMAYLSQAMAYLSQVRKIVGGDDFLDMIERIEKLQVELDALKAQ